MRVCRPNAHGPPLSFAPSKNQLLSCWDLQSFQLQFGEGSTIYYIRHVTKGSILHIRRQIETETGGKPNRMGSADKLLGRYLVFLCKPVSAHFAKLTVKWLPSNGFIEIRKKRIFPGKYATHLHTPAAPFCRGFKRFVLSSNIWQRVNAHKITWPQHPTICTRLALRTPLYTRLYRHHVSVSL